MRTNMSEPSKKGKELENHIAKTLRKKLGARVVRDRRSGAGSHQKMDLQDYYRDTPFDIEAKNHKTIAIKAWMRQAMAGAGLGRIPAVVFRSDEDVFACLSFDNLVDLQAEIQQLRGELELLKQPMSSVDDWPGNLEHTVAKKKDAGYRTCRNRHLVSPGSKKCLMKGCPFSSSFKAKKR